jgi:hypothetical protein
MAPPVSFSVPVFLRELLVMVSNQQLLANFGLSAILALEVLPLPPYRPRRSLEFMQVRLMLFWRKPNWFWHLTAFCLFP